MSYQENRPYVVSVDSQGLLKSWARKNCLTVPNDEYFQGMLADLEVALRQYFAEVDIVPEEFLRQGLNGFVKNSSVPVVSLDRAYINPKQNNLLGFLDATRTVDSNLNSTGVGSRDGKISLERQIGLLAAKQSGKVIALVDDVIFEGKTIKGIIQQLRKSGIEVTSVYAGIAIQEGIDLLQTDDLEEQYCGVRVIAKLPYAQVTDEICERDFVVGSPYSGRSVINGKGVIEGAPYLYPFGKPVEWASIPSEEAMNFSLFCLYQSLQLWTKIEQLSRQNIPTQQIDKPVFCLPKDMSMSSALSKVVRELK